MLDARSDSSPDPGRCGPVAVPARGEAGACAGDARSAALLRQFAKPATTFVDIGAGDGAHSVLAGLANRGCRVVSFAASAGEAALVAGRLRSNGVAADVRVLTDVADLGVADLARGAASGPVVIRLDWPGHEIAVLESLRVTPGLCDDVRLFVEVGPGAPGAPGPEIDALLVALAELGLDAFLLAPEDGRHARCGKQELLEALAGAARAATLCCLPKARSLDLCVFSHSSELGGAELCVAELVDQMTSGFGSLFTVVMPGEGPLRATVEALGAFTVRLDSPWWCWDPAAADAEITDDKLALGFLRLRRALPELSQRPPDAVVTSTVTIPWGAVAAAALDRPHVWWVHEYGRRDHGFEFRCGYEESLALILESSNHVVATSQPVKDELFPGAPAEKCSVASYAPLAIPSGAEVPVAFRRPGATRLVHTGRVVRTKGQEDVIRAVKLLVEGGRDVELCIAGAVDPDSEYASMLRDLVDRSGLSDRVHFLGAIPDVIPVVQEAHVSVTCSRCEAYGRVTAEAMLLGTPVVGTDAGGTAELIDDGVDGFLYPPGDAAALAEKIAFFVDRPGEIAAFGSRAASSISRRIDADRVDVRFFEVCLEHKGGANPRSAALARLSRQWEEQTEAALERELTARESDLRELERRFMALQHDFDERTKWALALRQELADIQATFAWQAGRALRHPRRAWRAVGRRRR